MFFECLALGVDVVPIQHALHRQPERWGENPLRTDFPGSPHAAAQDILLRFQSIPHGIDTTLAKASVMESLDCEWWPAWCQFPQARPLVYDLMRRVEASRIGRVMLTRLAPGKRIEAHIDEGAYASAFDRYHVVIQGAPGCVFRADTEEVQMRTGECWWFQNRVRHEVANNSADERVHLIVDLQQ